MWPLFIEKLLLAIIDANPLDKFDDLKQARNARRTRLELAMQGLFGTPLSDGDAPTNDIVRVVAISRDRLSDDQTRELAEMLVNTDALEQEEAERRKNGLPARDVEKLRAEWREFLGRLPPRKAFAKSVTHEASATKRERVADTTRLRDTKYPDPRIQEYLSWLRLAGGHEEEAAMYHDLCEIATILDRWNVPSSVDPKALALGSLT